jgi:hypothetical protein
MLSVGVYYCPSGGQLTGSEKIKEIAAFNFYVNLIV